MWQGGLFTGVSHISTPRGWAQPLQLFGVPLYLCILPVSQNYQIRHGNTCGGGACILGSATPHSKRVEFQDSPFSGFSCIYAHTL